MPDTNSLSLHHISLDATLARVRVTRIRRRFVGRGVHVCNDVVLRRMLPAGR